MRYLKTVNITSSKKTLFLELDYYSKRPTQTETMRSNSYTNKCEIL